MGAKRIFLIRHGETNYNVEGIVQGRLIDSSLNQTGQTQKDFLFNKLSTEKIDHIYLSTLKRTYQTMKPFIDLGIPYSCENDLDELCFGDIEGKSIFDHNGDSILKTVTSSWKNGEDHIRFQNGESPREGLMRIEKAFIKILAQEHEQQIILCLHQRILRIVMCFMLNKPLSEMDKFPHNNTGVTTIEFHPKDNKFTLIDFNNTNHIALQTQA